MIMGLRAGRRRKRKRKGIGRRRSRSRSSLNIYIIPSYLITVSSRLERIAEQGNDQPTVSDNPGIIDIAHGLTAFISQLWGMGKSSLIVQDTGNTSSLEDNSAQNTSSHEGDVLRIASVEEENLPESNPLKDTGNTSSLEDNSAQNTSSHEGDVSRIASVEEENVPESNPLNEDTGNTSSLEDNSAQNTLSHEGDVSRIASVEEENVPESNPLNERHNQQKKRINGRIAKQHGKQKIEDCSLEVQMKAQTQYKVYIENEKKKWLCQIENS